VASMHPQSAAAWQDDEHFEDWLLQRF
jgi:hypothetical protein